MPISSGANTSRVTELSPVPREPPVTRTDAAPLITGRNFTGAGFVGAGALASLARTRSIPQVHNRNAAKIQLHENAGKFLLIWLSFEPSCLGGWDEVFVATPPWF